MSHSKKNEMQEGSKEAPLTNGHSHLVNGALKPEDLSPVADQLSVDKDLAECRVKSPEDKPLSHPVNFQTRPDPYEFPHSPPKQSDQLSVVYLDQSSLQEPNEQRPKLPPPTYQEAIKATESRLLPQQLQPPCQVDSNPGNALSPATRPLSRSPIRLNGSHHNAFSSNPASLNTNNLTVKPDPPTDKTSSSESSAQLLAQTGGLISEFYSHSRLHQISTWRTGFSEYVNELHSKRKAVGGASLSGKERLRKSVAQRSTHSQGMAFFSVKFVQE